MAHSAFTLKSAAKKLRFREREKRFADPYANSRKYRKLIAKHQTPKGIRTQAARSFFDPPLPKSPVSRKKSKWRRMGKRIGFKFASDVGKQKPSKLQRKYGYA